MRINSTHLFEFSVKKKKKKSTSPLRTDQIQRSSSPLISPRIVSQIIRCNFPVSERARHSAILTEKWLQSSSHWNFWRARRFFSRFKLLSVFFCLISAASHQRPDARAARTRCGSRNWGGWAGSAAAMGGGCLSQSQLRHVAISQSLCGTGKRRVRALPLNTVAKPIEARHLPSQQLTFYGTCPHCACGRGRWTLCELTLGTVSFAR